MSNPDLLSFNDWRRAMSARQKLVQLECKILLMTEIIVDRWEMIFSGASEIKVDNI